MASRDEIVSWLSDLLEAPDFADYTPNGLQVPGAPEVELVATAVTPGLEVFERATQAGAQMVLTHHGMLGDFQPAHITPSLKRRLEALFAADLSLVSYHLPLDAHEEVGNNSLICDALGMRRAERFGSHRGRALGFVARSDEGVPVEELRARCARAFGQEPLGFWDGPDPVHSLGVVSGAAASSLGEAIAAGLDGFLTGEPAENVMLDAREAGVHFIAGGHYGTETFGVQKLGDQLSHRFGTEHRFIDVPNPI